MYGNCTLWDLHLQRSRRPKTGYGYVAATKGIDVRSPVHFDRCALPNNRPEDEDQKVASCELRVARTRIFRRQWIFQGLCLSLQKIAAALFQLDFTTKTAGIEYFRQPGARNRYCLAAQCDSAECGRQQRVTERQTDRQCWRWRAAQKTRQAQSQHAAAAQPETMQTAYFHT
jgi:hypothetical protein